MCQLDLHVSEDFTGALGYTHEVYMEELIPNIVPFMDEILVPYCISLQAG